MNSTIPGADESEELTPSSSAEQSAETTAVDTAEQSDVSASETSEPAANEPVTSENSGNGTIKAEEADESAEAQTTSEDETEAETEAAEPVAEAASEAPEPATMAEAMEQSPDVPVLKRGELLDGTVISTSPTSILVDVGGKAEGVIPGRELERMNRETLEMLKEGATVPVFVVNPHDHQGNVVLSVNRALEERDWQMAEEYRASQEVYESRVAGYNKGGLIVRFGRVRGFVPQSQISAERRAVMDGSTPEERWGEMVNETIAVKVMEVDRSRNRLILSERAAAREVRESRKENLIGDLAVGEVRTGRVVSLVDFGAFIDIGGAEGLVHLTELSWQHVTHPRELLNVGDEVKVEVISVDPDRKRIGLSMKSQAADPWDTVAIEYNVGQLVQGTITKLTKFGAFAQLVNAPEIEGLVHISELSDQRVNHPREVVNEGDTLTLRVVKMDIENRRLGLSLKRVNSPEYLDQDWNY
ncbi:MAG: 30S ribosomal protein S1 [Anaerolineaceae bacterium]|nr:30S ribosomal protein S1 [Anaerolineaceae bacterium]